MIVPFAIYCSPRDLTTLDKVYSAWLVQLKTCFLFIQHCLSHAARGCVQVAKSCIMVARDCVHARYCVQGLLKAAILRY